MTITTSHYVRNTTQMIRGVSPIKADKNTFLENIIPGATATGTGDMATNPVLRYLAIGAGGHLLDCAKNDISEAPRSPLRSVLYKHIPWVAVNAGSAMPTGFFLKASKAGKDYYFLKDLGNTVDATNIYERDIADLSLKTPVTLKPGPLPNPASTSDYNVLGENGDIPSSSMVQASPTKILTVEHEIAVTISAAEFTAMKAAYKGFYGEDLTMLTEIATVTAVEGAAGNDVKSAQLATISFETIALSSVSTYNSKIVLATKDTLMG